MQIATLATLATLAASPLLLGCSSGGEPPSPVAAAACGAQAADGIEVSPTDVHGGLPYSLGYPPYAIDGCRVAYVAAPAPGEAAGALLVRDLGTGAEVLLASAAEEPRRPSMAGDVLAWEATEGGAPVVRVAWAGEVLTATGPFHHAGEPRAAEDGVVMTGWLDAAEGGDTDIFWIAPGQGEAALLAGGPGQQRFPDISAAHIAFADFAEDPDGRFDEDGEDLADVVVHDRASGAARTRAMDGKQAFPMLGAAGKIAYLAWEAAHPEPKFREYDLVVGDPDDVGSADEVAAAITTSAPYVRPAARGDLLEWVEWPPEGGTSLWRRPADLSAPAEQVPGLLGLELYGPSASARITVLAARTSSGALGLRGIAR